MTTSSTEPKSNVRPSITFTESLLTPLPIFQASLASVERETPPVFKLGQHILSLIFKESAKKEDVLRLTLMCSFFCDILQRLPWLFSAVCITTRPQCSTPPSSVFGLHFYIIHSSDHLSTLLKRTLNASLAVMIDFPSPSHRSDISQKTEALSMLSTLCLHSDRWETLVINCVRLFQQDKLDWQTMLPGSLDKLKRFSSCDDIQPIMESMKHWLSQIHVLHMQFLNKEQLETLSEAPWLLHIHDLTLKYEGDKNITSSTRKLLLACHALRSLHIHGLYFYNDKFEAITLHSLTELTFGGDFPLSCLQTPALTCLTINESEWIGHDPLFSYPCLKKLSITSRYSIFIFKQFHLQLYDSLFLNFLDLSIYDSWTKGFLSVKARKLTIHRAQSFEATFISMLQAMSGVLEELELVDVDIESESIDLFSKRDECVQTVREFRFRNQQYQRWVWTPSTGWDFLGM